MYKLYGISNCDTVRKAKVYLENCGLTVHFVDFKKCPPTEDDLKRWIKVFGDFPVNTKGVTYKKHKEEFEKLAVDDKLSFLREHSSMIKRPILEKEGRVLAFGFDEDIYKNILK